MTDSAKKLPPKYFKAISGLLTLFTVKEAAQEAKISEVTLYRWMRNETFQAAYRDARKEAVKQAIANLQRISSEAVNTLRSIMTDNDAPPSSRVAAARTVIEQSIRAIEFEELEQRITVIERAVEQEKRRK